MNILEPEIFDDSKPSCVIGVLTTENGKVIADELYEMLIPKYNVYKVEQAPPGKEFEYPAIKFAIDLCKTKKLKQILYLHTKGAFYPRPISIHVRQGLWKQEFVDNIDWYVEACNTSKPMVACPATNSSGTTWYNGFFMNLAACESVVLKKELRNRYYYEHIFCQPVNRGIKVIGRLFNNVSEGVNLPSHKRMNEYVMNLKVAGNTSDACGTSSANNIEKTVNSVKKKRVIYTCITGGYEMLAPLTNRQPDFDYICFTDNSGQTSSFWELRPIPDELLKLSSVKQQRLIKICPHRYLPEYDESLWIDGAIDVISDPNKFIEKYCSEKNKSVFIRKHPCRNCIYGEATACLKLKKDVAQNINPQLDRYKQEGFPKNFGLVESNFVYRKHNDPYCVKLMNTWAIEIINGSHRDQLSFNYALWKVGNDGFKYLASNLIRGGCFKWYVAHNRGKYIQSPEKKKLQPMQEQRGSSIAKKNQSKKTVNINTNKKRVVVSNSIQKKNTPTPVLKKNTAIQLPKNGNKVNVPTPVLKKQEKKVVVSHKKFDTPKQIASQQISSVFGLPLKGSKPSPNPTPLKITNKAKKLTVKGGEQQIEKTVSTPKQTLRVNPIVFNVPTDFVVSTLGSRFVPTINPDNKKSKPVDKPKKATPIKSKPIETKKSKPVNVVTKKPEDVSEQKKKQVILKQGTRVLSRRVDNISEKKMEMSNKRNRNNKGGFFE